MHPRLNMHTMFDGHLTINGRKIYCSVVSEDPEDKIRPFLLCIQGGPGFSCLNFQLMMKQLHAYATKRGVQMPNLIFYDHPGCGRSDKAEDKHAEYNVDNFTDVAAGVVEQVKAMLRPDHTLDLRVDGRSFGSLIAMNLPMRRPDWVEKGSSIRLRQIVSSVGPNGAGERQHCYDFLRKHHSDHPEYENMLAALTNMLEGTLKDQDAYRDMVFNLAPLYAESHASFKSSWLGQLLVSYPSFVITTLEWWNWLSPRDGMTSMLDALTGCSLEVLNHFFATDYSGFDLTRQIEENVELYLKVPICLIASTHDHVVSDQVARNIHHILGLTSGLIVMKDKHSSNAGPNKRLTLDIQQQLICSGKISDKVWGHKAIDKCDLGHLFMFHLERLTIPVAAPASTTKALMKMGARSLDVGKGDNGVIVSEYSERGDPVNITPDCHVGFEPRCNDNYRRDFTSNK